MVAEERFIRQHPWVGMGIYITVLAMCFSDLPMSLLGQPTLPWARWIAITPTISGSTFLFIATGFALHWELINSEHTPRGAIMAAADIILRKWALLFPLAATCVLIDTFVTNVQLTLVPSTYRILPRFLSLSQAWTYGFKGNSLACFGLASSNVLWIASDLFFVTITYSLAFRLVQSISSQRVFSVSCVTIPLTGLALQTWIGLHHGAITEFALQKFGPNESRLEFSRWLLDYSPYFRTIEALLGAMVCEGLYRYKPTRRALRICGVTLTTLGLSLWFSQQLHQFNLVEGTAAAECLAGVGFLLIACSFPARVTDDIPSSAWWPMVSASALSLWCWHLIWYNAFAIPPGSLSDGSHMGLVDARLIVVAAFAVLMSVGFYRLLQRPFLAWIDQVLSSDDNH